MNRRPRSSNFEDHVMSTLESQDRMLEKLEKKLEKPVLNGGFDNLVQKVETIVRVTERLQETQEVTGTKVDTIHTEMFDPETGLYHKVKANSKWIDTATKASKWFGALLITGALAGVGKLAYDFLLGHIHFTP